MSEKFIISLDFIDMLSYVMAWVTFFACIVYTRAFSRHRNNGNEMVKHLSIAIMLACILLGLYTAIWDIGLRTRQLFELGHFQSRQIFGVSRIQYMLVHFSLFGLVSYHLGKFLQYTVPENIRKNWPWYRSPFYPNERYFW